MGIGQRFDSGLDLESPKLRLERVATLDLVMDLRSDFDLDQEWLADPN